MAFLIVLALWALVFFVVRQWRARSGKAAPATAVSPAPGRPRVVRQRLRALPEGHRPPPGLGPLSPSERFLTQEAARGMRELEAFLSKNQAA